MLINKAIRSVKLDPKDAWHEIECPYCEEKGGLSESSDTPPECGNCDHCQNTVKLINDLDA